MSNPVLVGKGKNPHPWRTPMIEAQIPRGEGNKEFVQSMMQVDHMVSTPWGKYFAFLDDILGGGPANGQIWWCRANLTGVQVVGTDVLNCPYFGYMQDRSGKTYRSWLLKVGVRVKVAPSTTDAIWDILRIPDGTGTPVSIFAPGSANKLVLPVGDFFAEQTVLVEEYVYNTDVLRFDIVQADGVVDGAHIAIMGTLGEVV